MKKPAQNKKTDVQMLKKHNFIRRILTKDGCATSL